MSLEQSVGRLEARRSPTDDGGTSAPRESLRRRLATMQANLAGETRSGAISIDATRSWRNQFGAQLEQDRAGLVAVIRAGVDGDSVNNRIRRIRIGMLRAKLADRFLIDSEAAAADALPGQSP